MDEPDAGISPETMAWANVSLGELFLVFFKIGVLSFGGGTTGWVYREVVADRHWLSEQEFFSGMAFAQLMPGTNISNLTVVVGQKVRGPKGVAMALAGLLIGPFVVIILLSFLYARISRIAWAQHALEGIATAAIGMVVVMAVQGARQSSRHVSSLLAFMATFVCVGIFNWPMALVVLGVGTASVLAAAWRRRR